jgi:hypothetical protein
MGNRKISGKICIFLSIAALLVIQLFFLPSSAYSIVIKPGNLDHLVLEVPSKPVAGESFGVGVKVFDSNNNLITNYDQTGRDIQVSVSGAAKAVPSVLKASAFSAGSTNVRIEDTKAEEIKLILYDADIQNPLTAISIRISPNALDHFAIEAPGTARAGERFKVQVTAEDRFGNTVTGAKKSDALKVQSAGSAQIKGVTFPDFVGGTSSITAMSEKTGTMYVEVISPGSAVKGRSDDIEITPADLDHFAVTAPSSAVAGSSFHASIVAYDRFNNVVYGYAALGKGVEVKSSGGAPVAPSYVSPGEFKKGSATAALVYEKAEDMTVTITEKGGSQRGTSTAIAVRPAAPDHFKVSTPQEATADDTFRLKIDAYDRFENLIKDYDRTGKDVYLSTSGTGKLTPGVVSTKEFVNGTATIDVHYDKAESISISASLAAATSAQRKAAQRKAAPRKAAPKKATPRKVAPQKPVPQKPAPRKPAQKETKASVAKKPRAQRQEPPPLPAKPERKVAKRIPPKEVIKEQRIFGIQDIKIIEAGPRALVVIKVPGLTGALMYEKSLESIRGKDWIKLSLAPAENDITKELAFESDLIGTVQVKDNPQTMVTDILIELLPKRVQYSIKRDEDSLVIDVLRLGVAR